MSTQKRASGTAGAVGAGGGLAGMAVALSKMKISEGDEKAGDQSGTTDAKADEEGAKAADETVEEKPKD